MTAEIAILNNNAIALAADSAVTIRMGNEHKIYNSANKLFMLSKHCPVGIMVYGRGDFMDIPWETIIKVYRKDLNNHQFSSLEEYCNSFFDFLRAFVNPELQEKNLLLTLYSFFNTIREDLIKTVDNAICEKTEITDKEGQEIIKEVINSRHKEWNEYANLPQFDKESIKQIKIKYKKQMEHVVDEIFGNFNLTRQYINKLKNLAVFAFVKDYFFDFSSGVVIAGFGGNDIFPRLYSYIIECSINNELKYKVEDSVSIENNAQAALRSFAQGEMVYTFMEGMDRKLQEFSHGYLQHLFGKLILEVEEMKAKKESKENMKLLLGDLLDDYFKQVSKIRKDHFVNPVLEIVRFLPKEELAAMAESLVNLTSLKRKITRDAETVGGPIDVAVISKGDGFIWIKRKHYFKAELNHHYFKSNEAR